MWHRNTFEIEVSQHALALMLYWYSIRRNWSCLVCTNQTPILGGTSSFCLINLKTPSPSRCGLWVNIKGMMKMLHCLWKSFRISKFLRSSHRKVSFGWTFTLVLTSQIHVVISTLYKSPNIAIYYGYMKIISSVSRLLKPLIINYLRKVARWHFIFLLVRQVLQKVIQEFG